MISMLYNIIQQFLKKSSIKIIFSLTADNAQSGKDAYLHQLVAQQSARCHAAYVVAGCGYGESTQDMVFPGHALLYEDGNLIAKGKKFCTKPQLVCSEIDVELIRNIRISDKIFTSTSVLYQSDYVTETTTDKIISFNAKESVLTRKVEALPFIPKGSQLNERCEEVFNVQTLGLARRMEHTRAKSMVIGISGGLDSTLALLACANVCDILKMPRTSIVGVTMPGFGTTDRTYTNALSLMKELGITIREISIKQACLQHFSDIGHDVKTHDVTYENSQARERTQLNGPVMWHNNLAPCTIVILHLAKRGVILTCEAPTALQELFGAYLRMRYRNSD